MFFTAKNEEAIENLAKKGQASGTILYLKNTAGNKIRVLVKRRNAKSKEKLMYKNLFLKPASLLT
ncbi:hypothetical protein PHSC3_000403 [Chlamydiales bacterium STE3]|nr:hypothetical protein PHSC3_000403 [Chlamydiales bacterium STE3]